MSGESNKRGPVVLLIGAIAALVLVAGAYLVGHFLPATQQAPAKQLLMGPAEQAYVPQIQFVDPKVARATNFLNQEVTFVFGTVVNNGTKGVRQIEITLEFHDVFNQVVLRDKQRLFDPHAVPLAPYQRHDFQLDYETLPAQWNQAYPAIRITGLALE